MAIGEIPAGTEWVEGDNGPVWIVESFAAHAAMTQYADDIPGVPVVMLDLGLLASGTNERQQIRVFFEKAGATDTAAGMLKSVELLDQLANPRD